MNVVFKVYWNNPIEMTAEAGTQQLTFEVPLGAIISNPSSGGGTASYPSFIGNAAKVLTVNATEDDVEWTAAVTQVYVDQEIVDLNATLSTSISSKADVNYVDTQDGLLQDQIDLKADVNYVDTQDNLIINSLTLKADATSVSQSLGLKADVNYVDTQDSLLQDQIDLKADAMATSQSLVLKADLINGVIPASQLPSYVDDVLNFPDLASFPFVGEGGKIYIAEDTNKTYRWGGSSYVDSGGGGVALGETSSTAYRGDNGKIAYDHSQSQGNPHNTTTSDINEGTKLFFTESRVNQTVLTGLNTSTATPALATDQLLAAIGKLQAQINSMGSGGGGSSGGITWVDVSSIAGTQFSIPQISLDMANTKIWLAKKDGNLWLKGYFRLSSPMSSAQGTVFRIKDTTWFIDADPNAQAFPASWTLFHPIQPATCFIQLTTTLMDFNVKGSASATGWGYVIYPTCIGKAK